ncbi:hypothetical protein CVT24_003503 [Panaeolus cyanescens]|uniref:BTB domain-containing protein n=1 Tax=Panaeolus cyanescens TaxID=181874 RepID=A0A409Y727_9AGAR|nr:hypothetical protein CVT24_003503 [Panaeolus cyanescens]
MHSPGPSASDIQSHLYSSFLQASTYDVAIRVTGNWTAVYKLHRVVLIQSGFFRSLFTAGFAESTSASTQRAGGDQIHVVFDDYNITRPAFEICISRLYGGGPPLHISPSLIPTPAYPLSPPFSGVKESEDAPAGKQPASPRFLLSLLSTAIYLSIPAVASQALALILKTIGPTTVIDYLNFACGRSITFSHLEPDEIKAAVGLENVAQMVEEPLSRQHSMSSIGTEGLKSGSSPTPTVSADLSSLPQEDPAPEVQEDIRAHWSTTEPLHHYGAVSDKIGESCACWLARWAVDLLHLEAPDILHPHDSRSRSQSLSSIRDRPGTVAPLFISRPIPTILRPGGLTAKWIAALVSADTLFVPNERGRYNFARAVVELRRKGGIDKEEEAVWTKMFEEGIYYCNMGFEDIMYISQDISPSTKRPYVPLSVLQASHWTQSLIRHHITHRMSNSSSPVTSSPSAKEKELGIAFTTAELLAKASSDANTSISGLDNSCTPYYPVLGDMSLRIGDNGGHSGTTPEATTSSMEELFSPSHSSLSRGQRSQGQTAHEHNITSSQPPTRILTTELAFFGLLNPKITASVCAENDPNGNARWTPYPPYRFSVEFWDLDWLREKSRLHSQTIWYAGSLFNVYVQVVRKKGQAQLGIYLHRQSHVDPIPASSTPSNSGIQATTSMASGTSIPLERSLHIRQPSLPSLLSQAASTSGNPNHYSPSIHPPPRSATPAGTANIHPSPPSPSSSPPSVSILTSTGIPATITLPTPSQPYRDPRSSISAYFAITCASATGSSQTRFSSSPDVFSVSQSWGWKSSSLRTEEFMEIGTQTLSSAVSRSREISLRATVLLGLV